MNTETTPAAKPSAQVAGVQGFEAFTAEPSLPDKRMDWPRIVALPAFQMFMVEIHKVCPDWATSPQNYAETFSEGEMQAFYSEYCDWHKNKGYWPNETPCGKLIEGD